MVLYFMFLFIVIFLIIVIRHFVSYTVEQKENFAKDLEELKVTDNEKPPSRVLLEGVMGKEELLKEKDELLEEKTSLETNINNLDYKNEYPSKLKKAKKQYKANDVLNLELRNKEKEIDTILKTTSNDRKLLEHAYKDILSLLHKVGVDSL